MIATNIIATNIDLVYMKNVKFFDLPSPSKWIQNRMSKTLRASLNRWFVQLSWLRGYFKFAMISNIHFAVFVLLFFCSHRLLAGNLKVYCINRICKAHEERRVLVKERSKYRRAWEEKLHILRLLDHFFENSSLTSSKMSLMSLISNTSTVNLKSIFFPE